MREEAGIALGDETGTGKPDQADAILGLTCRIAAIGLGVTTSGIASESKDEHALAVSPGPVSPRPGSLGKQPTINPNLAPGTASGIASGPAGDSAEPVDWDLWQTVVYEGPAAVARTSPEELNRAIASGIPQAIRGVVWQVLAQSKNEELEGVYRELVARGTEKEHSYIRTPPVGPGDGASHANGSSKEKDSIASSSSSIHSDISTPATTAGSTHAPLGSPPIEPELTAKEQAKLAAAQKQKAREEAATLQKLEKTIKRDLGARTSYSKYVMAAGLQDGLFGICKAYALFDESVGYAQGMNFIAMPLLFNVSQL